MIEKETNDTINNVHDKMFRKTFGNLKNSRGFLSIALPKPLQNAIDLSELEIDDSQYVDDRFKDSFSDIVVKAKMKSRSNQSHTLPVDIYFLFEHKCYKDKAIFIQLLLYMYLMWQKDLDENKPPRVIIPLVFYHGKESWDIPHSFKDQFDVSDEVKGFLMDFRYVLFDTKNWDFDDERNAEMKDNVFLLTSLALMKSAFNDDLESMIEIFKFWHQMGFVSNLDKVLFFLAYITETKDINQDQLKKILEESKIDGGEIMPTLAQRWRDEGRQEGWQKGEKEGKMMTAKELIKRGVDINIIADATGFSIDELEKLVETAH